jgi:hypothetical protein
MTVFTVTTSLPAGANNRVLLGAYPGTFLYAGNRIDIIADPTWNQPYYSRPQTHNQ